MEGVFGKGGKGVFSVIAAFSCVFFEVPGRVSRQKIRERARSE